MNPYFSEMKKREKSNENHKASLRQKLRKIKTDYLGHNENVPKEEYDFPKMTDKEFREFKTQLEKERKIEKIKTTIILILIFLFGVITMIYTRKDY